MNSQSLIKDLETLRRIIPLPPAMLHKRILPALDNYCREFIGISPLAVLAFADDSHGFNILPCADNLTVLSDQELLFSLPNNFHTKNASQECRGSLYCLVPGIGHGLRVNGGIYQEGKTLHFRIDAVYFHCARAKVRGDLWKVDRDERVFSWGDPCYGSSLSLPAKDFIQASPWLLLRTQNRGGDTELSPRGDPAGFVRVINEKTLILPERPGNKVAVSLSNILENENIALLFFIPGQDWVLQLFASAKLTSSKYQLEPLSVNEKQPKVGIVLSLKSWRLDHESLLQHSNIWDVKNHYSKDAITPFPKVIAEHMNGSGVLGKLSTPIVNVVVKKDLKNLY